MIGKSAFIIFTEAQGKISRDHPHVTARGKVCAARARVRAADAKRAQIIEMRPCAARDD